MEMTVLVAECPRCGARNMTFVLKESASIRRAGWETFGVCRGCKKTAIFKISRRVPQPPHTLESVEGRDNLGPVTVSDRDARSSPQHVPEDIAVAFREGAKCQAVGCFNAAAAMFRLTLERANR